MPHTDIRGYGRSYRRKGRTTPQRKLPRDAFAVADSPWLGGFPSSGFSMTGHGRSNGWCLMGPDRIEGRSRIGRLARGHQDGSRRALSRAYDRRRTMQFAIGGTYHPIKNCPGKVVRSQVDAGPDHSRSLWRPRLSVTLRPSPTFEMVNQAQPNAVAGCRRGMDHAGVARAAHERTVHGTLAPQRGADRSAKCHGHCPMQEIPSYTTDIDGSVLWQGIGVTLPKRQPHIQCGCAGTYFGGN